MKFLENFDHWSDSNKLRTSNNKIGIFDADDQIEVDEDNYENFQEIYHILTLEDVEKLKDYFRPYFAHSTDGKDVYPFEREVGKTLFQIARTLDNGDFETEYLIDYLTILFPDKFKRAI